MRNDRREEREELTQLLAGVSDNEVHVLAVQALRKMHRGGKIQGGQVEIHNAFPTALVTLLAERKGVKIKSQWGVAVFHALFLEELEQPYMLGVFDFVAWLTRAGLASPLHLSQTGTPIRLRLTRLGERFVAHDGDDPLLPGYVERIRKRCPRLPDGVTSLLAQSKACLDHALMQPAISLMGVAYELAVEAVMDSLIRRRILQPAVRTLSAARRIDAVKAEVPNLFPRGSAAATERHFSIVHAYDFADQLRRRRNDASHTTPTYGFEDRGEAEELLVSAGRHLPNLWRVARK